MGYYTCHNLTIENNKSDKSIEEIKKLTVEILRELNLIDYVLEEDLSCSDSAKWYEHEEDMRKISEQIKDVLFLLEGEGEESGDVWKEYYLNGKMQRCQAELVFPEFNEDKLK